MAEPNLELLQAMAQRTLDKLTEHDGQFDLINQRLTAIERHLAGVRRDAVLDAETTVNVQAQVDQLGTRIGRIERRLDLAEATP